MNKKYLVSCLCALVIGFGLTQFNGIQKILQKIGITKVVDDDVAVRLFDGLAKKIIEDKTIEYIIPVAVLGAGPAGLSAALYTARAQVPTVVFEGNLPGGQLTETTFVENWPAVSRKLGLDIMKELREQAQHFGVMYAQDSVVSIDTNSWPYRLITVNGLTVHALTVVIATGAQAKKLNIPGEKEYWGKGVSACATCDAPLYKDRVVAVIGGGDVACEQATYLATIAKQVYVLVRADHLRASPAMQKRVQNASRIKVMYNTKVKSIIGDGHLISALELEGDKKNLVIDGLFVAIGHTPTTAWLGKTVTCNESGYIILNDRSQATNIPGIFAAGDVADARYQQAGVAAGDGIKAGLDAQRFLSQGSFTNYAQDIKKKLFIPFDSRAALKLDYLTTMSDFERLVIKSKMPVLVDFYTTYCPSCMAMLPILEKVHAEYTDRMPFYKVDGGAHQNIANRFMVTGFPAVLIFKEGIVVIRHVGSMQSRELHECIQSVL
jgi:thioredoxin reductase (NADPH)